MSARITRKRIRIDSPPNDGSEQADEELLLKDGSESSAPDTASAQEPGGRKRDNSFWFDDGTVILVARDVEFRVYSGILSVNSPVFKELFAQTNDVHILRFGGDREMTCPVVPVTDSPEDLRHILRAYMPGGETSFYDAKSPAFDVISACIRLGHKYQLAPLYEQSLHYLKSHYPATLESWDAVAKWSPPGWDDVHAVGVLNLARLIGDADILPTALMACTTLEDRVVHGFTREDGSPEHLTLDDLGRCFKAKTDIRKARLKALFGILDSSSPECRLVSRLGERSCRKTMRDALARLAPHIDALMDDNPFAPYTDYIPKGNLSLCLLFQTEVNNRHANARVNMWKALPEIFGIEVPGWGLGDGDQVSSNDFTVFF